MKSVKVIFIFTLMAIFAVTASAQVPRDMTWIKFFNTKYTKNQVYDVQRSPAYPVVGDDWTLSGLKNAMEASGTPIDWGKGRFLRFSMESNPMKEFFTYIDDANNSGKNYGISLKLFESNGKLVKVVSKWGKLVGMGAEGCMYEIEGMYGTFFSSVPISASSTVKYKPTIAEVTKISELGKGSAGAKQGGLPVAVAPTKPAVTPKTIPAPKKPAAQQANNALDFYKTKFYKNQVWKVSGVPENPKDGEEFALTMEGPALIGNSEGGKLLNWGENGDRYLMFYVNRGSSFNQITDDIGNDEPTLISAKLFEHDGTESGIEYRCGVVMGLGSTGVVYGIHESESIFDLYFSVKALKQDEVVSYKPIIANVTKLSQLQKK